MGTLPCLESRNLLEQINNLQQGFPPVEGLTPPRYPLP